MKALFFVIAISLCAAVLADVSLTIKIVERLLQNSDKTHPLKDGSTDVTIGMYVNDMTVDNEKGMFFLNAYFRQAWQDPRLAFDESSIDKIMVPEDCLESFWRPDIFFRNMWDLKVFYKPVPNFMMSINATGHVWYVYKAIVEVGCPTLKQSGNADCSILFESFKYTADKMTLSWLPTPVEFDPDIYIKDYILEDKALHNCTRTYTAGTFPCLEASFALKRDCYFC